MIVLVVLGAGVVIGIVAALLVGGKRNRTDLAEESAPAGDTRWASDQPGQGRPAGPGAEPMATSAPGEMTPDPDADVDGSGGPESHP